MKLYQLSPEKQKTILSLTLSISIGVFVAEVITMVSIYFMGINSIPGIAVMDAALLSLLATPIIYLMVKSAIGSVLITVEPSAEIAKRIPENRIPSSFTRLTLVVSAGIFLAEIISMLIIFYLEITSYWLMVLADATILILLVLPIFYFSSFLPILNQIAEQEVLKKALISSQEILETEISARTQELASANVQLNEEVAERLRAEQELYQAQAGLELRIQERTGELAAAIRELESEIEERKKAEARLRVVTRAMEMAANGIIVTTHEGHINWANNAFVKMTGYELDEILGQSPQFLKSGKHDDEHYQIMWKTITSGAVWHGEMINQRKDGTLYFEEQIISPVVGEGGKIENFIAIKQDITERKWMYGQIEQTNRELVALSKSERDQRYIAEGLVQASLALNMSLDLDAVFGHIFEQTRKTIPYQVAEILFVDGTRAQYAQTWGDTNIPDGLLPDKSQALEIGDFPHWQHMCVTKMPLFIHDTADFPGWEKMPGLNWIQSYLGAPLIHNDQVIGMINLASGSGKTFTAEMIPTLKAFAASAAVAVQNARLYEAEKEARRVAEIMSTANTSLSQTLDIEKVLSTLVGYVQTISQCDLAFVVLLQEQEGENLLVVRAVRGSQEYSEPDFLLGRRIDPLEYPIIQHLLDSHTTVVIKDVLRERDWRSSEALSVFRSWFGIPLESAGKVFGVVTGAMLQPDAFNQKNVQLIESVAHLASVAVQNAWLFEQVNDGRERLQKLSRRLVEVQENERRYIARELHDETSQALTSLKLGLHFLEQDATKNGMEERVAMLKNLTDDVLESLHHLAMDLRPASLDHVCLQDALNILVESVGERSGLNTRFKVRGEARGKLGQEVETSIYRIVQESLTNVVRHARASRADVIVDYQDEKVVVIVEDDGVGFDTTQAHKSGHLGLVGMEERAEMLGGILYAESTPNVGTTLFVEIPYAFENIGN